MSFNGYSEYIGDQWYAMGCPSLAELAAREMGPGEHYPDCPQDPDFYYDPVHGNPDDPKPGDPCSCFGDILEGKTQ